MKCVSFNDLKKKKGGREDVSLLPLRFIPVLQFGSVPSAGKCYSCIHLHLARSQGMNKVHKSILGFVSLLLYSCALRYYISKAIQGQLRLHLFC